MKKQFVTYEIALELKELGFDEECCGAYKIRTNGDKAFSQIQFMKPNYSKWDVYVPLWQQLIGFLNGILYKSHDKTAYSPEWIYFDGRDYEKLEKDVLAAIKIIKDGLPGKGNTN